MNRRHFVATLAGSVGSGVLARVLAQGKAASPDLASLAEATSLTFGNREVKALIEGTRRGVRVSEAPGESAAFVPGVMFSSGTIELDMRGKDVAQRSFVGVSFHGVDTTTFDAVYFRPFNFRATNPENQRHAVQYHSLPTYTWQKLRAERTDQYEKGVSPVPDPNGWFHARITVNGSRLAVFVDNADAPCLAIDILNERRKGLVGLWVGNNSGGDFANLTIANS